MFVLPLDKKKIIRNWVFKIGYPKALQLLKKEHDDVFVNLKDEKTMNRLEEVAAAIEYINFLQETNAHNLSIFK